DGDARVLGDVAHGSGVIAADPAEPPRQLGDLVGGLLRLLLLGRLYRTSEAGPKALQLLGGGVVVGGNSGGVLVAQRVDRLGEALGSRRLLVELLLLGGGGGADARERLVDLRVDRGPSSRLLLRGREQVRLVSLDQVAERLLARDPRRDLALDGGDGLVAV